MDNFDLRKYLAEGKLFENKGHVEDFNNLTLKYIPNYTDRSEYNRIAMKVFGKKWKDLTDDQRYEAVNYREKRTPEQEKSIRRQFGLDDDGNQIYRDPKTGKELKENIEGDFETYYERWKDEDGTNEDNFLDFDEWNDGNEPGSKTDFKTWEIGFEEEDEYYGPILNNMINYLKKNKTYSYKNDDGVDAEFSLSDDERNVSMAIYYTADDIKKYLAEGKLYENEDDSYYIDKIKRDLEELDDKEANEYLEDLAKAILKLKR